MRGGFALAVLLLGARQSLPRKEDGPMTLQDDL
jgi:hypothetical protein